MLEMTGNVAGRIVWSDVGLDAKKQGERKKRRED